MVKEEDDSKLKEGEDMSTAIKEQGYKGLSLSPRKLKEITITPKVKDGKALLNKKD